MKAYWDESAFHYTLQMKRKDSCAQVYTMSNTDRSERISRVSSKLTVSLNYWEIVKGQENNDIGYLIFSITAYTQRATDMEIIYERYHWLWSQSNQCLTPPSHSETAWLGLLISLLGAVVCILHRFSYEHKPKQPIYSRVAWIYYVPDYIYVTQSQYNPVMKVRGLRANSSSSPTKRHDEQIKAEAGECHTYSRVVANSLAP